SECRSGGDAAIRQLVWVAVGLCSGRLRSPNLDLLHLSPRRDLRKVLARIDERVLLRAILLFIELAIASAELNELAMRAALDNLAALEHQDLIGALDRRQAVRDDERRAAAAE